MALELLVPLLQVKSLQLFRQSGMLDWALEPGSRWGLLGGTGSGKSALLRVLARLRPPAQGTFYWNGIEVNSKSRRQLNQLGTWVTLLYPNPYTALEPWQPIRSFFVAERGAGAVPELRAGLSPAVLDYPVRALSGAARVRLMFLRALASNPAVMLVDDVASWLIPEAIPGLVGMMDAALGPERALLMASRSPQALSSLPHWLILDAGSVVEWGPQAAILADPVHLRTRALLEGSEAAPEPGEVLPTVWQEVGPGHWARR